MKTLALKYLLCRSPCRPGFFDEKLDHWCDKALTSPKIKEQLEAKLTDYILTGKLNATHN